MVKIKGNNINTASPMGWIRPTPLDHPGKAEAPGQRSPKESELQRNGSR
jgi:hypothetical protein